MHVLSMNTMKVAWVRNNDVPPGEPAPGHLHCPCGNSPESNFNESNGDVICNCGRRYSWDGWVKGRSIGSETLTAYRVIFADGSDYATSMSEDTTLAIAYPYFMGRVIEGKRVVRVEACWPEKSDVTESPPPPANVSETNLPAGSQMALFPETPVTQADENTHKLLTAQNQRLEVGTPVYVRWGYGLGFQAEAKGEVFQVFPKSVQVKLIRDVLSPGSMTAIGWPAGFVLKGIPRYCSANLINGKWNVWSSVTPIDDPEELQEFVKDGHSIATTTREESSVPQK